MVSYPSKTLAKQATALGTCPAQPSLVPPQALAIAGLKRDSLIHYFGMPGCESLCSGGLSKAVAPLHKYIYMYMHMHKIITRAKMPF